MSDKEFKYITNADGSYKTREQIKHYIMSEIPIESLEEFRNILPEDLCLQHHFGMGIWIRNNFGLWAKDHPNMIDYKPELRDGVDYSPIHPDAVSMDIVEEIHKELNDAPSAADGVAPYRSAAKVVENVEERLKKLLDRD
jgi:hypothetical protein